MSLNRSRDGIGAFHDRLGVAEIVDQAGGSWVVSPLADDEPIVDIGDTGTFDSTHVLDPAAVRFRDRVLLYYSGVGDGPDAIGLATSRQRTRAGWSNERMRFLRERRMGRGCV